MVPPLLSFGGRDIDRWSWTVDLVSGFQYPYAPVLFGDVVSDSLFAEKYTDADAQSGTAHVCPLWNKLDLRNRFWIAKSQSSAFYNQ